MDKDILERILKPAQKEDLISLLANLCRNHSEIQTELLEWSKSHLQLEDPLEAEEQIFAAQQAELEEILQMLVNLEETEDWYDYQNGCGDWWYEKKYGWDRTNQVEDNVDQAYRQLKKLEKQQKTARLSFSRRLKTAEDLLPYAEMLKSAQYEELSGEVEDFCRSICQPDAEILSRAQVTETVELFLRSGLPGDAVDILEHAGLIQEALNLALQNENEGISSSQILDLLEKTGQTEQKEQFLWKMLDSDSVDTVRRALAQLLPEIQEKKKYDLMDKIVQKAESKAADPFCGISRLYPDILKSARDLYAKDPTQKKKTAALYLNQLKNTNPRDLFSLIQEIQNSLSKEEWENHLDEILQIVWDSPNRELYDKLCALNHANPVQFAVLNKIIASNNPNDYLDPDTSQMKIVESLETLYPDQVAEVYLISAERLIARSNARSYDKAILLLTSLKKLYRRRRKTGTWKEVLQSLQNEHRTKRKLLEKLEGIR